MKGKLIGLIVVIVAAAGISVYLKHQRALEEANRKFACGNGRLEATEVNITAKLAGRIEEIKVQEGDLVKIGDKLVQMQINTLSAELAQANAEKNQAEMDYKTCMAQIKVCEASLESAKALLIQKERLLKNAKTRVERTRKLVADNAATPQELDDDQAKCDNAEGNYQDAVASVKQCEAALASQIAATGSAKAKIDAKIADAARIQADIDDSSLIAPRRGRIQYRIAEPGEVVSAGGRILNLVDLTDVYLTFFVPARVAGVLAVGDDARIVLDALPKMPIPAKISYVASVAQFTPKTVETKDEREKLMFRVKARIDARLCEQVIEYMKTGLPGVAWVKIKPDAEWPKELTVSIPDAIADNAEKAAADNKAK